MKFADLGLSDELLKAVADAGYDEPTPIQAQAIPPVLMMKDIIGIAQTGTGKTASFVLPMIDILAHGRSRARMPRSLILEPTRELAAQVAENFEKYGKNHNLSMALLIGGVSMGDQVKALEKGVDVLIATPGRLMDLFERGRILMSGCELLVIDEADRMLDMGFIPDIEQICSKLPSTRQTMLFSATMPPPIKKLSDQFLNNPKSVEVSRPATANTSIDQSIINVAPKAKRKLLYGILDNEGVDTAIIFCNRKTEVRDLCQQMRKDGFDAGQIHGDMDQSSRLAELERFKSGEINILCASDVAARGLDIKGVSHVVNYDIPWHPDDYVHRIGRTGRAGATGIAITFVTKRDDEHVDSIEKLTGIKIPVRDSKSVKPEKKQSSKTSSPDKPKGDKPKKQHADDKAGEAKKRPSKSSEKSAKPAKEQPKPEAIDEEEDGWNGPVPGFLDAKLNR
ncbi:DEAD/DEAH box helicase [Sphingorhabdus sp. EL138]|uniref:DEAD/DEAH box helicase n=1 Tax=Sphingorhabdus sp. EL138 TaxID=2073156 RepID=UPI000D688B46|nr:DEAD/DEAH box helicase [Sphingorhabdus sp. EL138]